MTKKRRTLASTVIAVVLLQATHAMAGGAFFSPPPGKKVVGPAVTATVVIDPHNPGVTSTAGLASIRLQKGSLSSAAVFAASAPFPQGYLAGCALSTGTIPDLTANRFERPLTAWIPGGVAPGSLITTLFSSIGIALLDGITVLATPAITDVDAATCTPDPANPGPLADGSAPGVLTFTAVVQFLVDCTSTKCP